MKDRYVVGERLKDADPFAEDGPLADVDAQRMRRVVVEAARERTTAGAIGWTASWVAVTLAVAASAVFSVNRWREPDVNPTTATTTASHATTESRRQLQFVAPGGTRVIWVFNADFKP